MDDARSESSSKLSASKARKPWRRRLAWLLALLFSLFLFEAVQTVEYARHIPTPPPAEIAIVLGARSEGTTPLPVFRERIEYSLRLYQEGKVHKLLFTGAPGEPPQAVVARDIAVARGVPDAAILLETRSTRTIENLRFAKELLPDPQTTKVLIVSDPLHLRRAMLMAEDLGLQAFPAPTPTTQVRSFWRKLKMTSRESVAYLRYRIERLF